MRDFAATHLKVFRVLMLLGGIHLGIVGAAVAGKPVVKKLRILDQPLSLEFDVTAKAPVKVIRIGPKEMLVAMKNVSLANDFSVQGRNNPALSDLHIERLEGDVMAVVVTGKHAFEKAESAFNSANTRFRVVLLEDKSPAKKEKISPPVKAKTGALSGASPEKKVEEKTGPAPAPVTSSTPQPQESVSLPPKPGPVADASRPRHPAQPPVYIPPSRVKNDYLGDIDDIHRGDRLTDCEAKPVESAQLYIKKGLYQRAYEMLDQYIVEENFSCLELANFLKAYAYYRSIPDGDASHLLKAERLFQDALVAYPKSVYQPFAYSALGLIQYSLKNLSAAEGYFNIVSQGYKEYSGMPEVQYHLASIFDSKGYTDKALRLYKAVFESPVDNSYISAAGVGYGRSLFVKRQYYNALGIFNYVIENDAKKVYEAPELLRYTADADFELGLSRDARMNYTRLLNIFPDIPDRDLLLSKVGDAYGMDNQKEKAIKIYELVRERFPDTPGFINASIGIARYLETDPEKIEIYEMIKTRFPDNTYARIAMMRLAEIYQKNGEYNKCIKEIENLLSTHPRGLRYEAVQLMQRAYEALFRQQLKDDDYTKLLDRYERENTRLDKMGSRQIDFSVGQAYLKARLYEQAFNHLISAYKQYRRQDRTPELLFGLGQAMDESGRDEDALKLYRSFVTRFPNDPQQISAYLNIGQIYLEKSQYRQADATLKQAFGAAKTFLDKGHTLMLHARVLEGKGDLEGAAGLREKGAAMFTQVPGQHYDLLADTYKTLGNNYLALQQFVQAADAFEKALNFSEGERAKANIGFLLGDAYQKGNILDKAKEAFEQVTSYDSVWARMARQRLSTIGLAEKMINS